MNKIKWNSTRTGFVLKFDGGYKETYSSKLTLNSSFVRIDGQKYWLLKTN